MQNSFRSLRVRLLLPLLAVAFVASLAVAVASYLLGDRWARAQIATRYKGVEATLSEGSFPLTQPVVASLAELSDTQLITLDDRGSVLQSSLADGASDALAGISADSTVGATSRLIDVGDQVFRYGVFFRRSRSRDGAVAVAVLFDEAELRESRLRAAVLPLVTGLSTVILLTSVTLFLASRLIQRLAHLQSIVNQIAAGDFETNVPIGSDDEVGMLGRAVARMSHQLRQMWTTLQRQQGQKLLHQLAGGLAHQLRNSITGARMAVELHGRHCQQTDDSLAIALSQLEQTEGHIRRLLSVAQGEQQVDRPQLVGQCIDDVRTTMSATARHLGVELNWRMETDVGDLEISDGPSLHAAVTNLVLNAVQEATRVDVSVARNDDGRIRFDIIDNGDGPPPDVAAEIFEPFVTSKPEGLGLGLPLVARSARRLGGDVEWSREGDQTRFTVTANVIAHA